MHSIVLANHVFENAHKCSQMPNPKWYIYFTQDKTILDCIKAYRPRDMGVYNFEGGSLTTCFTIDITIFPTCENELFSIVPLLNKWWQFWQ